MQANARLLSLRDTLPTHNFLSTTMNFGDVEPVSCLLRPALPFLRAKEAAELRLVSRTVRDEIASIAWNDASETLGSREQIARWAACFPKEKLPLMIYEQAHRACERRRRRLLRKTNQGAKEPPQTMERLNVIIVTTVEPLICTRSKAHKAPTSCENSPLLAFTASATPT